jgi:hypothetical protein
VKASRRAVWDWLSKQEVHQLHQRPNVPRSSMRPIAAGVTKMGSIQMDSIQLTPFNGFARCVTAVDVFSRRLYVFPVKEATPEWSVRALTAFLNQGMRCATIQTDQGTEWKGVFPQFCEDQGITHRLARAHSPFSQGSIEKRHGDYKVALYKYMEAKGDPDWISLTPRIVDNLNSTPVAPLNRSPIEIEQDESLHAPLSEKMMAMAGKKYRGQGKGSELTLGQYVRLILPYDATNMRKAAKAGYWGKEIYRVRQVVQIRKYMNAQPVYKLENEAGEVMKGSYARWQLNPIPPPTEMVRIPQPIVRPGPVEVDEEGGEHYEVESIADRRVMRNGKVKYRIRYKGWKKLYWVGEEDVEGSPELIAQYERTHGPPNRDT